MSPPRPGDTTAPAKDISVTDDIVHLNEALGKTSSSLLIRVREKDHEAWTRLVQLYGPLVYAWCTRLGLQDADAADMGQEVFRKVANAIVDYHHERTGDTFRGWLHTITRNLVLDHLRHNARQVEAVGGSDAYAKLVELAADPDESSVSQESDRIMLTRRAVELVLENCKEQTREAFLRVVLGGQHPASVAQDLGISVNAVYLAKSHLLRRIREEFELLVDL
jgi:RNA polymerase sigma-70 factor (ECF subfamily)